MSLAQAEELPQAFEPKIYVPPRLKGIVDFIAEMEQGVVPQTSSIREEIRKVVQV